MIPADRRRRPYHPFATSLPPWLYLRARRLPCSTGRRGRGHPPSSLRGRPPRRDASPLWRAHLSLAKVLRSQGRDAEAAQEFAAAADLIEELATPIPAGDPATSFQAAATALLPRSQDSTWRRVYRKEFGGLTHVSWTSPG